MVIKESTKAAFDDFVGFHYKKNIDFKKKTLCQLFEILNLAEKYQTKELRDRVNGLIKEFPLNIENVVEVAATTQEFSQFETLSKKLYGRCVTFIEKDCTDVQSFLTFIQANEDKATVMTLLQDIKTAKSSSKSKSQEQVFRSGSSAQQQSETCFNCKKKPCCNGQRVLQYHVLRGMVVKTTGSLLGRNYWWPRGYSDLLCVVVKNYGAGRVRVTFCDPPSAAACDNNFLPNPFDTATHFTDHFTYACDQKGTIN